MSLHLLRLIASIVPIFMGFCCFGGACSSINSAFTESLGIGVTCADVGMSIVGFILGFGLVTLGVINAIYSIHLL
jgi:hypothetical protein